MADGVKTMGSGRQPAIAQLGRKLQMSAWTGVGQAKIDMTSRSGRTSLKVTSNALLQALTTLHPTFMATLMTVGMLSGRGMGLLGGAIGVGLMTLGVGAFTYLTRLGHRRADTLADELRNRIEHAVSEQESTGSARAPETEQLQQKLGR